MRRADTSIIVCPLAFEAKILARSGVPGRIICTGPGEAGMARLPGLIGDKPPGPVILTGLAAAIDDSTAAGSAHVITEVIGVDGRDRWRPSWPGDRRTRPAEMRVAASAQVLGTPDAKRSLASRHGAQLVDLESGDFARLAASHGWDWGVIRGVSDDIRMTLPPDIDRWVDVNGRTRTGRVLASCARRPWRLRGLLALRRHSVRALVAVAELLRSEE